MTAAGEIPELVTDPATRPKAALDQVDVRPFEGGLLALARVHHPTVAWWHGYRHADPGYGSFCYVCDDFIARWGGNSGPTMDARATIDIHKHLHRSGDLPGNSCNDQEEQPV